MKSINIVSSITKRSRSHASLCRRAKIEKPCFVGSTLNERVWMDSSFPTHNLAPNIQWASSFSTCSSFNKLPAFQDLTKYTSPDNFFLNGTSSFSAVGSTRSFGRKASRMGHHLETAEELANQGVRDEAQIRREEKKKKSKKARIQANKESKAAGGGEDNDENIDEEEDDSLGPDEDEFGNPILPEPSAVRQKMLMVVASLEKSFATIRGGEATPEMFDAVKVSAYGEVVPLSSVGQVVIEDPQRATISCYDPSVVSDVRDAVRDMPGMNLNPYVEEGGSGVVIIPIPRVSAETRQEIVKELGRQAEAGKQRLRRIRRDAMDVVKKGKDGKLEGVSKDDAFRVGKDVDAVTEEVLVVLNSIVDKKQKSVMED